MGENIIFRAVAQKIKNKDYASALLKKSADEASLQTPGQQVFIRVFQTGSTYSGNLYDKPPKKDADGNFLFDESKNFATIRTTDNQGESHATYGKMVTLPEIYDFVKDGLYKANVVAADVNTHTFIIKAIESTTVTAKTGKSESNYGKAKAELLGKGFSEDEIQERVGVLENYGINKKHNPELLGKILLNIRKQPTDCNIKKPAKIYRRTNKSDTTIIELLISIINGSPVCLEGPKSTGKNVIWETVSWLLNCQLTILQCGPSMTRSSMYGYASTDTSGKNALTPSGAAALIKTLNSPETSSEMDEASSFLTAMSKSMSPELTVTPGPVVQALEIANKGYGSILLLDEMNLSNPSVLSENLNTVTDKHTDSVFVTGLGNIPLSSKLIIGATQNAVTGGYLGTKLQNEATMSRFNFITLEAPSSIIHLLEQEREIKELTLSDEVISVVDNIYGGFINLVFGQGKSDSSLNIRGFLRSLSLMEDGLSIAKAIKIAVINSISPAEQREIFVQEADNFISSELQKGF